MSRQLTCGQREYTELMGSSPEEGLAGVRADTAATLADLGERRIRGNAVLTMS